MLHCLIVFKIQKPPSSFSNPQSNFHSSSPSKSITMDLQAKATHNCLPYLVKTDDNVSFHSTIDILLNSKYLPILTADAPINLDTLQEFWLNVEFLLQDKK